MAAPVQDSNTLSVENKKLQDDEGQAAAGFAVTNSSDNPVSELPSCFDDVATLQSKFADIVLENMYSIDQNPVVTYDDEGHPIYYVVDPDEIDSCESDNNEYDPDTSSASEDFSEDFFTKLCRRGPDSDDDDFEEYLISQMVALPFDDNIGEPTNIDEESDEEEYPGEMGQEVLRDLLEVILEEEVKETLQGILAYANHL